MPWLAHPRQRSVPPQIATRCLAGFVLRTGGGPVPDDEASLPRWSSTWRSADASFVTSDICPLPRAHFREVIHRQCARLLSVANSAWPRIVALQGEWSPTP